MIPASIMNTVSNYCTDDDIAIDWSQARETHNGWIVPVTTDDIDGEGPHTGNMTIETDKPELDYWVGDWEPQSL